MSEDQEVGEADRVTTLLQRVLPAAVRNYYTQLMVEGFPHEEAMQIVLNYQQTIMLSYLSEAGE